MSENADPYGDPYADMTPAYGSLDTPGAVDFSVEAAMPDPEPQPDPDPAPQPDPDPAPPAGYDPEPQPDPAPTTAGAADVPPRTQPAAESVHNPDPPRTQGDPTGSVPDGKTTFADPNPAAADPAVADALAVMRAQATESAAAAERQAEALLALTAQLGELLRLRARDVDLADRLYAENTRLRTGEFAAAVAPLLTGLLRLQDQMASLANGDTASVAGMLRIQLLQILDTAAGLTPFEPRAGERFDSSRHAGAGRTVTTDPTAEGTVAKTVKPGFERADGSVVRVAQVEVYRFESR